MLTVLSRDPVFFDPSDGAILLPGAPFKSGGEFWVRCQAFEPLTNMLGGPVRKINGRTFPCDMLMDFEQVPSLAVEAIRYDDDRRPTIRT
jgi:hypothetical protein